jgi:hypothetical protein
VSILFVLECKFSLINLLKATVVQTTGIIQLLSFVANFSFVQLEVFWNSL